MPVEKDPKRTVKAVKHVFSDGEWTACYAEPGLAEPMLSSEKPGYHRDHLMFACPGCGRCGSIPVGHPKPGESPSWDVTGGSLADVTTLTLSPSIHCISCCGWHGHLRNGVFVSC
jgi:hypothetical protein